MMPAFLIVDDESQNAKAFSQWLEKSFEGADVRWARTNREALKILESFAPTLVITDFRHPDGNGKELRDQLRSNPKTSHVPVVLVSAAASWLSLDQADFDAVVTQPCGYEEFVEAITQLLREPN